MLELRGAFTALITPFTADGNAVDFDTLTRNIADQAKAGITGLVPCGTTGETPTLSDAEYRDVVRRSVELARVHDLKVIPGAGANATAHAIELHRFVHDCGADASLQVSPYYNKPSQEGLYAHFSAIADSCDLPLVLYNIPGRCVVRIELDTIERLAKHPNIVAVKEATGSIDLAAEIVRRTDLTVLSGDDPLTLPLGTVGAVGVISVLSNLVPRPVAALCAAMLDHQGEDARRINDEIAPLARALLSLDTNPIPVKAALELLGRDTGALRLPLCHASETVMTQLRELLQHSPAVQDVAAQTVA